MAGDWIKFEVSTLDKQEVSLLADMLGIDHDAVIGKLLRVWAWADQNVTIESNGESNGDSVTVCVTTSFLDRLTFCQGFSKALESVGWLVIGDRQVVLPNFARHNGKTAKERALAAKRAAKFKDKGNDKSNATTVTSSVTSALPKEEKRKEEKEKDISPVPLEAIRDAYNESLPMLPMCRKVSGEREKHIRARWSDPERQTLDYWTEFFAYVAESDFLTGRSKAWGTWAGPDFDWLVNETNHVKVTEGKYENKAAP